MRWQSPAFSPGMNCGEVCAVGHGACSIDLPCSYRNMKYRFPVQHIRADVGRLSDTDPWMATRASHSPGSVPLSHVRFVQSFNRQIRLFSTSLR